MSFDVTQEYRLGKNTVHPKCPSNNNDSNGIEKYFGTYNNKDLGSKRPKASIHSEENNFSNGVCRSNSNHPKSHPLEHKRKKALVVECEQDILTLLKTYLEYLGLETAATDNCDRTINCMFDYENESKHECDGVHQITNEEEDYDIIIINNRLPRKNGLEIAKEICKRKPSQRIIVTTTQPLEHLPNEQLRDADVNPKDVLMMPFRLSHLRNRIWHCTK